jgi:hypothetical protein
MTKTMEYFAEAWRSSPQLLIVTTVNSAQAQSESVTAIFPGRLFAAHSNVKPVVPTKKTVT